MRTILVHLNVEVADDDPRQAQDIETGLLNLGNALDDFVNADEADPREEALSRVYDVWSTRPPMVISLTEEV
jgi:hypothetical protein